MRVLILGGTPFLGRAITDLVQFIDARDLAAFLADACHAGTAGVFNLTGTPGPFWIFIDFCKTAAYCSASSPAD